jgi:hypothetical protein
MFSWILVDASEIPHDVSDLVFVGILSLQELRELKI